MMPNTVRLHQRLPDAPTELVEELSRPLPSWLASPSSSPSSCARGRCALPSWISLPPSTSRIGLTKIMQYGITPLAAYLNLCTAVADCCKRQFET